ncbi:MAG TPA: TetR/AcrR family transcriptional regulator [Hyphomicrobiales bacterium]|nr:TetR/AcrR family transcriptional regulator [Hyphomicrobiales bacterium]
MPDTNPASVADAAVDALMALLAERHWADISLTDIAARAGVDLGQLRGAVPSKGAILAGFSRRIDQQVLSGRDEAADPFAEPARERLFDILMRRFDALAPHRPAIRNAVEGLRRDPMFAVAWNRVMVNSAQWMLAAAGIEETGALGGARAQALALLYGRVLSVWLGDEDPGLAKTMAALDRALRRAERLADAGRVAERLGAPFLRMARRQRRHRFRSRLHRRHRDYPLDEDDGEAAAAR